MGRCGSSLWNKDLSVWFSVTNMYKGLQGCIKDHQSILPAEIRLTIRWILCFPRFFTMTFPLSFDGAPAALLMRHLPSCWVVRIHQVVEIVTGRTGQNWYSELFEDWGKEGHDIEYAAETFCGIIRHHQFHSPWDSWLTADTSQGWPKDITSNCILNYPQSTKSVYFSMEAMLPHFWQAGLFHGYNKTNRLES